MRKLKITELNRISAEEFKQVEKLPLVVVLDDIRSLRIRLFFYYVLVHKGNSFQLTRC